MHYLCTREIKRHVHSFYAEKSTIAKRVRGVKSPCGLPDDSYNRVFGHTGVSLRVPSARPLLGVVWGVLPDPWVVSMDEMAIVYVVGTLKAVLVPPGVGLGTASQGVLYAGQV